MLGPARAVVASHWRPILLIQVCAVLIAAAYLHSPAFRTAFRDLVVVRERFGFAFSFVGMALACAVLPQIALLITGQGLDSLRRRIFVGLLYGCVGVMVDILYRSLGWAFGTGNDAWTLIQKTCVDLLIVTPAVFIPFVMVMAHWENSDFSMDAFARLRTRSFWAEQVPTGWVPAIIFWTPIMLATYSMPAPLQIVFAILCDAAWSTLLTLIAVHEAPKASPAAS